MVSNPRFFGPADVARLLPWPELIEAIERVMVEEGAHAPDRTVHTVPTATATTAPSF